MIPVLSHIEQIQDLSVWVTTDGKVGAGFEILPCDLETEDPDEYYQKLLSFLRTVDPLVLTRIKMHAIQSNEIPEKNPRQKAIKKLGSVSKKYFLFVESAPQFNPIEKVKELFGQKKENLSHEFQSILKVKEAIHQSGLRVSALSNSEIKNLFVKSPTEMRATSSSIETGSEKIGILRLTKQMHGEISETTISEIIDNLPLPFEISVSFRAVPDAVAKIMLERRLKQFSSTNDPTAVTQKESTTEAIVNNLKSGGRFFEFEFLVMLRRQLEGALASDLGLACNQLNKLSEFKIETFGVAPSFISTQPGTSQHVTLLEQDKALPLFLPLWANGESETHESSPRDLTLYRNDKSLFHFNLFNPKYSVFNTLVIGTSGKGKSVLTGLLTSSLLNDEDISVIKVDVGGSHSKECHMFGGTEFIMRLDQPSGINPFGIISVNASLSEKIAILSKFLTVLIQEQGEISISKDVRSQIEECVSNYVQASPSEPSLHNFYEFASEFPRKNLLKRWTNGGVYQSAFSTNSVEGETPGTEVASSSFSPSGLQPSRLRYYNFSQIFQASDQEFAQAGIAAVLAQFNIEMLTNKNRRLVLICDETPFFIKTCFEFFKFSTANVRKYGHAVILITQLSTDLIVNGDTGIIENSPQRFLFSTDGDLEDYQKRFSLTQKQIEIIKSLKAIPGEYSEVLLQSGTEARKLQIKITPEEYWKLTTSKQDQIKMQNLLDHVPGLKLEEAIKCLSIS